MQVSWRKIREEIQQSAPNCVVAVSGGVDSVFLLDFVSKCDVKFVVAYFDHKLGNGDEFFVKSLAFKYGAPFIPGYGKDIDKADSIEAEARTQRYRFLNDVKTQTSSDRILTGHHLNDQVETILLRLLRGYDHSTLGMAKFSGDVYRPFLDVPKEKIISQAEKLGLTWLEDASNISSDFERNFLRNEILKLFEERAKTKTHCNIFNIAKGLYK